MLDTICDVTLGTLFWDNLIIRIGMQNRKILNRAICILSSDTTPSSFVLLFHYIN